MPLPSKFTRGPYEPPATTVCPSTIELTWLVVNAPSRHGCAGAGEPGGSKNRPPVANSTGILTSVAAGLVVNVKRSPALAVPVQYSLSRNAFASVKTSSRDLRPSYHFEYVPPSSRYCSWYRSPSRNLTWNVRFTFPIMRVNAPPRSSDTVPVALAHLIGAETSSLSFIADL